MDIYSDEYINYTNNIISSHENDFRPTALMIRQHRNTKLLYLHKTVNINKIDSYLGSGSYWTNHLKKHTNDVELLWYCVYYDIETLVHAAISMSLMYDVVKSKMWANMILEDGLGRICKGRILSEESRKLISIGNTGKRYSNETNMKKARPRELNGMYGIHRFGESAPRYGIKMTEESRNKSSETHKKLKYKCPHCNISVDKRNLEKWHLDNCKLSPNFNLTNYNNKLMLGRVCRLSDHKELDCGNWTKYINSVSAKID